MTDWMSAPWSLPLLAVAVLLIAWLVWKRFFARGTPLQEALADIAFERIEHLVDRALHLALQYRRRGHPVGILVGGEERHQRDEYRRGQLAPEVVRTKQTPELLHQGVVQLAQDEAAVVASGPEPVEERRPGAADMQISGGARWKAGDDRMHIVTF